MYDHVEAEFLGIAEMFLLVIRFPTSDLQNVGARRAVPG